MYIKLILKNNIEITNFIENKIKFSLISYVHRPFQTLLITLLLLLMPIPLYMYIKMYTN
jgi:hypothetical protein